MRIVHVVLSLQIGGQERFILNLSRSLRSRGHDIRVISLTPGGTLLPEFGDIPIIVESRKMSFDPGLSYRLARTFARLRPDVVHTHNPGPLIYAAAPARAALVRRVIHTKHGANNVYSPRSIYLARLAVRTLSAFVAVSDGTAIVASHLEKVPKNLLHVIPNGVPLDQFGANPESRARIRAEFGIPNDAVVVGSVGRLAPEKNYGLLVRAMAPFLGEKTRLVFVGEGESRKDIEQEITPEIAPFITLAGMRRDVPDALASFDIFALSSRTEGLPLVIPEAMACSLPIVATAVGGVPDIVPPKVGTLVPSGDAQSFGRALEALIHDKERRDSLGQEAFRYAHERFSIEGMTRAYEELYMGSHLTSRSS